MKAIDLRDKISELLGREDLRIDEKKRNKVCLFHASKKTCRYIILTAEGYCCCKNTKIASSIDDLVKNKVMRASGDNCEGLGSYGFTKEKENNQENQDQQKNKEKESHEESQTEEKTKNSQEENIQEG